MDENQYLGEKSPFYNSPKTDKDNEKDNKKYGKYGKLFFPDVKIINLLRLPLLEKNLQHIQ
jgi:hypothetical protein